MKVAAFCFVVTLGISFPASAFMVPFPTATSRYMFGSPNRRKDHKAMLAPEMKGTESSALVVEYHEELLELEISKLEERRKELEQKIKQSSETAQEKKRRLEKLKKTKWTIEDVEPGGAVKVAGLLGGGLLTIVAGRSVLQNRVRKLEESKKRKVAERMMAELDAADGANHDVTMLGAVALGITGLLLTYVAGFQEDSISNLFIPPTSRGLEGVGLPYKTGNLIKNSESSRTAQPSSAVLTPNSAMSIEKATDSLSSSASHLGTRALLTVPAPDSATGGENVLDSLSDVMSSEATRPSPIIPDLVTGGGKAVEEKRAIDATTTNPLEPAGSKPVAVENMIVGESMIEDEKEDDSIAGLFFKSLIPLVPETEVTSKHDTADASRIGTNSVTIIDAYTSDSD